MRDPRETGDISHGVDMIDDEQQNIFVEHVEASRPKYRRRPFLGYSYS